jgi:hypothetical protein
VNLQNRNNVNQNYNANVNVNRKVGVNVSAATPEPGARHPSFNREATFPFPLIPFSCCDRTAAPAGDTYPRTQTTGTRA